MNETNESIQSTERQVSEAEGCDRQKIAGIDYQKAYWKLLNEVEILKRAYIAQAQVVAELLK